MTDPTSVVIHCKDFDLDEPLRDSLEKRCALLRDEFHEVRRVEINLNGDGTGYTAHGHVTGKGIDVGTHARASQPAPAAEMLLDKIERQLRRVHDKRIFAPRREAQRDPPKRRTS